MFFRATGIRLSFRTTCALASAILTISQIAARGDFPVFEGDTNVKNPGVEGIKGKHQRIVTEGKS